MKSKGLEQLFLNVNKLLKMIIAILWSTNNEHLNLAELVYPVEPSAHKSVRVASFNFKS